MIRESKSVEETEAIAAELGGLLVGGECIALEGELGAGKTQFVRGLVVGLGGNPRWVSSPTYVLLNIYPTPRFSLYHLDAFRVVGSDDLAAIGFEELLEQRGVVVVEWASRVMDLLPRGRIEVRIEVVDEARRKIVIGDRE